MFSTHTRAQGRKLGGYGEVGAEGGGCTHVVTFSRIGTRFSSQGGGTTFALRVWRQIDRVTLDLVNDQFTGKPLAHECLVGSVHIAVSVRPIDLSRLPGNSAKCINFVSFRLNLI